MYYYNGYIIGISNLVRDHGNMGIELYVLISTIYLQSVYNDRISNNDRQL
jgi:hypothetical protein